MSDNTSTPHVITHVTNRIGFIELNRPEALNALSLPMAHAMHAALDAWRDDKNVVAVVVLSHGIFSGNWRAFCAGGDVRFLYEAGRAGDLHLVAQFLTDEYRLDHAVFTYPKPCIALMNGVTMGGGMGITQGAAHTGGLRVVGTSTRLAMPETRIGFFPDAGVSWFLARTPGALGRYMAVTSEAIGAVDALHAGLADVYIDNEAWPALIAKLQTQPFENGAAVVAYIRREALNHLVNPSSEAKELEPSGQPAPAGRTLDALDAQGLSADIRMLIAQIFSLPDVVQISAALEAAQSAYRKDDTDNACHAWIARTIGVLRERSPLSMAVSLEVVTRAASSSLADCLRHDLDVAHSSFLHGDVVEGVRSRLIDRDDRPHWCIADIQEVNAERVARMFSSPWPANQHPLRDLRE